MDCLFHFKGINSHVKLRHISFSTESYYWTPLENLGFIKDVYTIILPKIICKILVCYPLHIDVLSCTLSYITIMCVREKNAQCERCELSSVWDKMRTVAHKTASQTSLRNSLEKVEGRSVSMWFGQRGIQALQHTFGRVLLLVTRRLLLVMRSRCLHYSFLVIL